MAKPNSTICRISSVALFLSFHFLIKIAILQSKHVMFLALSSKYLFIPKIEMGQKLPSHSYRFTDWLMEYRITNDLSPWGSHMLMVTEPWGFSVVFSAVAFLVLLVFPTFEIVLNKAGLLDSLILTWSA